MVIGWFTNVYKREVYTIIEYKINDYLPKNLLLCRSVMVKEKE